MSNISTFYIKNKNDKFIPITFREIVVKNWEDKLVIVKIGENDCRASDEEMNQVVDALSDVDVLESIENVGFVVSTHNIDFEVLGSLKEVSEKYITIQINNISDASKIGLSQRMVKEQLDGRTKKVIVLPSPIKISEYVEVKKVLKRLRTRRARRG